MPLATARKVEWRGGTVGSGEEIGDLSLGDAVGLGHEIGRARGDTAKFLIEQCVACSLEATQQYHHEDRKTDRQLHQNAAAPITRKAKDEP